MDLAFGPFNFIKSIFKYKSHQPFPTLMWDKPSWYLYSHFTNRETQIENLQNFLRTHSKPVAQVRLKPGLQMLHGI